MLGSDCGKNSKMAESSTVVAVIDAIAKIATPLIAGAFLWKVSQFVEISRDQSARLSKVVEKRIELLEELFRNLTPLYQFGMRTSHWCGVTPENLLESELKIRFWMILGRVYFSGNTMVALNTFLGTIVVQVNELSKLQGGSTAVCSVYEKTGRHWNVDWDSLFNGAGNPSSIQVERAWNVLLDCLKSDIQGS